MKEVFESLIGMFFLIILCTASLSCIAASIDARNADANKSAYIAEIEESNFAGQVIESVFTSANNESYDVSMKLYHKHSDGSNTTTTATSADEVGNTSDVYMVKMQLTFDYSFPFLNSVVSHTLIGYAR